jgi:hypothetical protein
MTRDYRWLALCGKGYHHHPVARSGQEEVSLGVTGMPMPILITENNRDDRSERAPSHFIFIRVPRRGADNGQSGGQVGDDLAF